MASQEKKRWAQLKVGMLAIVALLILTFLVFLMTSSQGLFKSRSDVYVFMDDSAAIATGAPVRVNGINAGKVSQVGLSGSNTLNRIVRLTLQVDNDFLPQIPADSQVQIAAENLLGTKYINIKKGKSASTIQPGAELKSLDTHEFDDVVQQGYSALASLDGILKKLDGILDAVQVGQGTIGKLLKDEQLYNTLLSIAKDTNKVVVALDSQEGTLGKLIHDDSLYTDVRGTLGKVNDLADAIQKGDGTVGKLVKDPALYDETRAAIGDVRQVLTGINKGEGTVGKLLKSDDLHNQLQASMGKLDAVLDKINSGQGTVGQLLVNPSLYESLDGTSRELNGLMKDFRANPKKFLRIKISIF